MHTEIHCPKCPSTNVIFSKKRSVYVCEDCGHEFVPVKPFAAKRIFISYGHDEHATLAIRLRDDLKQRGHLVWFDAEHIHAGLDWELRIEQGLKDLVADRANSTIVLLLTPHSVRRPNGYCLNEVAYAQTKGLRIIPVMVVETEPPLSICRIQWLDMRECIPIHMKEALYLPRFERLLKALEAGQLDFEGTQSRLIRTLIPIQFSADIIRLLKDFTGRRWVFNEVDAWLNNSSGSKIFWITGAPGAGKSAISAWIRDYRREVAAFHFCDINSEEKRNPCKLVCSVVYQLSTQLPEYQDRLARLPLESFAQEYREAYTLFDKLLIQPLADNFPPPDRTVVVLIDALDEATYQRQNEIVRFLSICAHKTPPWLRFLVTSRPEPEIVSAFQALSPYVLDTSRSENLQDLSQYLAARLPGITPDQTRVILERSEGVFLYVQHVVEAIVSGQLSLQRPNEFPRGLGDVYQQFFQRQFGGDLAYFEQTIVPFIQPALVAYEPLTLGFLKRHCAISDDTGLFRILNHLGSLFPATGQTDSATLRPFHRSLSDWITDRNKAGFYVIAATDGHKSLANHGWAQFERGPESMDNYLLQWLPAHLRALGDNERLVCLLKNFRFLMEITRRGMIERLLQDFFRIDPNRTNPVCIQDFVAAFFRERAYILRRDNQDWPAYKILLQLASEHADNSPLTLGAEQWLSEGRCDWAWFHRIQRSPRALPSACLLTLDGHVGPIAGALELAGNRLLSWSDDSTLRLWDTRTGACLNVLTGHHAPIKGALGLADGQLLSWSADHALRLWDSRTGNCLAVLEGHTGSVTGVLVLTDNRVLSWSEDRTLRVWDTLNHLCLATLQGHHRQVSGAKTLADGRLLSWSEDQTLRTWDHHNGRCLMTLEGHANWVRGVLELSNERLLSWSRETTLRIWDSHRGECLKILQGHSSSVCGALELDNGQLLTWSDDQTIRLWDGRSGICLVTFKGHSNSVSGLLPLDDGRLVSWSMDGTLRFWNQQAGTCLAVLSGHNRAVNGVMRLHDGRLLSWSNDNTLRLWDSLKGDCLAVLRGHTWVVTGALEMADGLLLSWAHDHTLRLWNSHSNVGIVTLDSHAGFVQGVMPLGDGRVVSWSEDKSLRVWDCHTGGCLAVMSGHGDSVQGLITLTNGHLLSWAGSHRLMVWDSCTGDLLMSLEDHSGAIRGARALAGEQFLSWSEDGTLRLWNSQNGVCLAIFEGHRHWVNGSLELADKSLLSWSEDQTLRVWDRHNASCQTVLNGHTDSVSGALVLSDGRLLSWSVDHTLRLWEIRSGRCLAVLKGHLGWIDGALELADGRLLSWSADQTLRLWDSQNGTCLEVVRVEHFERLHPELRLARCNAMNPAAVVDSFWITASHQTASLHYGVQPSAIATWCAGIETTAQCLLPNGTMVVTLDSGQVCFLQLRHGQRRISLAEAKTILTERGELSEINIQPAVP